MEKKGEVMVGGDGDEVVWSVPRALKVAEAGQVLLIDDGLGGLDVVVDNRDGKDLHCCGYAVCVRRRREGKEGR